MEELAVVGFCVFASVLGLIGAIGAYTLWDPFGTVEASIRKEIERTKEP